ncbi:MAG TPA: SPFH domain-containing protein [Patescibacteria group bacterium]|nr:SPFH domain-containing protein [Patescibacteria group bacterium]
MEFDRLVVSFLADEVVGGFFISVPPGHIACVYDRGRGVLPIVWGPGLHLKIPFWQIAKLFNAQMLEYTIRKGFDLSINPEALGDEPVHTTTADGKVISIEGSILFRIDKHNAPELWENIGEHFVSKLVRPLSRSRIAAAFSSLKLEEITARRTELEKQFKDELNAQFHDKGLICEGVLLSEVKTNKESGEGKSIFSVFKGSRKE